MNKQTTALAAIAVLALALALAPSLAFAAESPQSPSLQVGGQATGAWAINSQSENEHLPADFGNDGYKLYLDGDSSGWVQYYVDGANGTIDPDVKLYYENGDDKIEIPADAYDLKWQRTWYDEDQGKDCYADAQFPLGLVGADEGDDYSGIGNEFEVVAVPKSGNGFTGQTEAAHVMPVDSKTFNYHAKHPYIEGAREAFVAPTWHTGFVMATSIAAGAQVKVRDDAVNSENGDIDASSYTVTYYKRKPGPYDTDEENYGFDVWVESDETRLDGFPTEAGTYFAVIEGTGDYFGSTTVDFDIIDGYMFAEVWLDRSDGDGPLYSDGSASFTVNTGGTDGEEGVDWDIVLRIGKFRTFDDTTMQFDEPLAEGDGYTYDAATRTVTLDGAKAFEAFGGEGVVIRAFVVPHGQALNSENALAECYDALEVREARADYDREQDRSLLPGWDGTVDGKRYAYVEDSAHPDGYDDDYQITDVKIISQDPEQDGEDVLVDFHKDADEQNPDDYWWYYKANGYGTATIEVTYRDLDGAECSYTFEVNVSRDVYDLDLRADSGITQAHPGGQIELTASCRHHSVDGDVYGEDAAYAWRLREGAEEFATIQVDSADSSRAVVAFKDLAADDQGVWQDAWVEVELLDGNGGKLGYRDICLTVADTYPLIWPASFDSDLAVGGERDITAEARLYSVHNADGCDVAQNARFWVNYDENAIQIRNESGTIGDGEDVAANAAQASFTIKRLEAWNTRVLLHAEWQTATGDMMYCEREYQLDEIDENACTQHDWAEKTLVEPLCETPGKKQLVCISCGEKRIEILPPLGHAWGEVSYAWSSDLSSVTATRTCAHATGPSCTQAETVRALHEVSKPATYTSAGETTYSASFLNPAFEAQFKVVADIPQLAKLAQPMGVSAKVKSVKAKKLKKKALKVSPLTVTNAKGSLSYKVVGGKAKSKKALKVNAATGKITVKKKTRKGTYSIKVRVTAAGTAQYSAGSKTVTVKVKVK